MKATVFGARGFVGSHLVRYLESLGVACDAIARGDETWQSRDLGHVFYCIGLTADFRERPLDAIEAHVGYLTRILRNGRFESLLYLSSTRLYGGASSTTENATLTVNPNRPDDLYNLSKLLGEAACLGSTNPRVRVARLSNVYGTGMGSTNFLGSVIRDAVVHGHVTLNSALDSEKDYVSVDCVVESLAEIALRGRHRLTNVASGRNTTHRRVMERLEDITHCAVAVAAAAPVLSFPAIDVTRLREQIPSAPSDLEADMGFLIDDVSGT